MSKINSVSNGYLSSFTQVKNVPKQQSAVEYAADKNIKQESNQLNALYQQSSHRTRQKRDLASVGENGASVKKRNVLIRVRGLNGYIDRNPHVLSGPDRNNFNQYLNNLKAVVQTWTDANENKKLGEVETIVYKMQCLRVQDPGIIRRLSDLRKVRHISHYSPIVPEQKIMENGKKAFQNGVVNTINEWRNEVMSNPNIGNGEKYRILCDIDKLKNLVLGAADVRTKAWEFRNFIDNIRVQINDMKSDIYCKSSDIMEKYFIKFISQIDKIEFPEWTVSNRKKITITGPTKLLMHAKLNGKKVLSSESEIIPGKHDEILVKR